MWAGRRPAHILVKPLPNLFLGAQKKGKNCRGKGRVQCWRASPNHRKIKNPIMLFGIFGNESPKANPQTYKANLNIWSGVGALLWGLGLPKGWWLNSPLGLWVWLVGWLVCWMLAEYWTSAGPCWPNLGHMLLIKPGPAAGHIWTKT